MSELQDTKPATIAGQPAAAKEPRGIGGWLLLVAFGQVIGPLQVLVMLGQAYFDPDTLRGFERYPLAAYGELALKLAATLLVISTAVLFFRKSRYFPRFFICELVAAFTIPVLVTIWIAFTLSAQLGVPVSEFLVLEPPEAIQLVLAVVAALIWIPYTLRSRRVRNTFGDQDDQRQLAARTVSTTPAPRVALLRAVVFVTIALGSVSVLAGLGHAIGRGAFSGSLLGGLVQIGLAVWLFRGSDAARIILAVLFFAGFVLALGLPLLVGGREPLLIIIAVAMAAIGGLCFWILTFSTRLRAELAVNAARYRKREPEEA